MASLKHLLVRTRVRLYCGLKPKFLCFSAKNAEQTPLDGPTKRSLAPWQQPVPSTSRKEETLKLYNSLTRNKDPFVPHSSNRVNFYVCGPTVYDFAHVGHARSYVSFDLLRRVLKDYFRYDVNFVLNITDVDDKIIKRARHEYLVEKYFKADCPVSQLVDDVCTTLTSLKQNVQKKNVVSEQKALMNLISRIEDSMGKVEEALRSNDMVLVESTKRKLLTESSDMLFENLTTQNGRSLEAGNIFTNLARRFESEFHLDMKQLNVAFPDAITRVSEYMKEIIEFIRKIVDKGFAYESNGSVYFDTAKFIQHSGHYYPKLKPEAFVESVENDAESPSDVAGKRNLNDFALWKSSKIGEPQWPSPWGNGRPGWHIECSAMASHMCGSVVDLHGGGADLQFPHHDNELAQSEAYFGCQQWVNYFVHTGVLTVSGAKMSKSLNNFVTVKDALKQYTVIQLKLLFFLYNWWETLDYSASAMRPVLKFEKTCNEFFMIVKHYLRSQFRTETLELCSKYENEDMLLDKQFIQCKSNIHAALCDSVNTRDVLNGILELISHANQYISEQNAKERKLNLYLLNNIAVYITSIFRLFGLTNEYEELGLAKEHSAKMDNDINKEDLIMPYVNAIVEFRQKIRLISLDQKNSAILRECDRLRNEILPSLGVRLEDREGHTTAKLCDAQVLLRERQKNVDTKEKAKLEKEHRRQAALAAPEKMEEKLKTPPGELFKLQTHKYSIFDSNGIPTHDANGKALSLRKRKNLESLYLKHKENYERYCASKMSNVNNVVKDS